MHNYLKRLKYVKEFHLAEFGEGDAGVTIVEFNVRVVHGKGTGALRKGVHNYLKRLKYVKEFHLAEFGEGDAGVTIVEFKK